MVIKRREMVIERKDSKREMVIYLYNKERMDSINYTRGIVIKVFTDCLVSASYIAKEVLLD